MAAMGGESRLRGLAQLHLDIRELAYRIDDSERAHAPYWVNVRTIAEDRDLAAGRYRQAVLDESAQWVTRRTVIDDGQRLAQNTIWKGADNWIATFSPGDRMAFAPERILFTAGMASDLRAGPDVVQHGARQHDLKFTWKGFPVDLYIDAASHRPTRVTSIRTDRYNLVQSAWGDVRWRTDFLFWKREADGLFYPRQWSTFRNGEAYVDDVVIGLRETASTPATAFLLPPAAMTAWAAGQTPYAERPIPGGSAALQAVGDGVWMIAGGWNVMVVRQADGLVVVEAPQSAGYSVKILALLAQSFPSVPVKALVTTTDSLWHFAGIRTYVAHGIPIYALGLTVPYLQRFIAAPHTFDPDELSRKPVKAKWRAISGPTPLGAGPNRLVIYPIGGQGDERMLMVYLPGHRLLYGSSNDLGPQPVTDQSAGTFNLPELVESAHRNGLKVDDYVAIHTSKVAWSQVERLAALAPLAP